MKTQISRNSFKAAKRYSGVYQQQGRMLTDADWNNLVDILKGHLAEALKDVVGNGSPRTGKLKITTDRQIQPGDLYVGGLRAELPGTNPIDANTQEDFPGSPNLPATGPYIVYADVWERSLTALEDPDLRDAGLNGADTCTRTQTMLQVKVCPEDVDPEKDIPQHGDAALTLTLHDSQESDDPCDPCAGQIGADEGRIGNYLFRVEVHLFEEETEDQPTRLILKWSSENGAEQYEAQDEALMPPGFVVSGRYTYEFLNLMSEKHLGVHLNPDPDFSPTFFELKQTYEIPEKDPDDPDWYVRRWDGYCELTYDGSIWSLVEGFDKGVTLSTAVADTAPGHVSLNSALSINLEALKLDLELKDKKFVAGDYWLAPVREAEHVPDSTENDPDNTVLAGSPPEGIIHHYLGLTRVEADGTVDLLDNDDAEKRRHNFPPLTDLLAGDVGYLRDPPDCANGWFDATHDNVEKALNRLCELTAAHIPYKADCSQGLFQGFEGTVKQALDTVCSIQAGDVGFTETCNTSIYLGQTVATVQDALHLLCDVKAGQIAYQPGAGCTYLDTTINTVQAALDALCTRPSGGGCKVTVGEGGVFKTLEEALTELLSPSQRHICLCLLPGRHMLPGQTFTAPLAGVQLCLSGCGPCTRLYVRQAPVQFSGFDVLCLSDMEIITQNAPAGALVFDHCREVSLKDAAVFGFMAEGSLIEVREARAVTMHDLLLEASGPGSLEKPSKFLDLHPALADLYKMADRTLFDNKATEAAKELAVLGAQERRTLAVKIDERAKDPAAELAPRERKSYQELAEQLRLSSPNQSQLDAALQSIRLEAVRMRPTVALTIMDAEADWSLRDCDILGIVVFYGSKPSGPLPDNLTKTLDTLVIQGGITFAGTTATFRASGCRVTRIDISASLRKRLENAAQQNGVIDGLFSTSTLSDCTLVAEDNQLALLNTQISSSVFEVSGTRAALVMGDSSIYVGNRGGGETVIVNITPPNRTERAANLALQISA